MPEVKIGKDSFQINEFQKEKMIKLLKEIKSKEEKSFYLITESYQQLPDIVRIIVDGFICDLARRTFINYRSMISDIMRDKKEN